MCMRSAKEAYRFLGTNFGRLVIERHTKTERGGFCQRRTACNRVLP